MAARKKWGKIGAPRSAKRKRFLASIRKKSTRRRKVTRKRKTTRRRRR